MLRQVDRNAIKITSKNINEFKKLESEALSILRRIKALEPTVNTRKYGHMVENEFKEEEIRKAKENIIWFFEIKKSRSGNPKAYLNLNNNSKGVVPKKTLYVYDNTPEDGISLAVDSLESVDMGKQSLFVTTWGEVKIPSRECIQIIKELEGRADGFTVSQYIVEDYGDRLIEKYDDDDSAILFTMIKETFPEMREEFQIKLDGYLQDEIIHYVGGCQEKSSWNDIRLLRLARKV